MAYIPSTAPQPSEDAPPPTREHMLTIQEARERVLAYRKGRRYSIAGAITGWVLGMGLVIAMNSKLPFGGVGFVVGMGVVTLAFNAGFIWYKDRYQGQLALEWAGRWCPNDRFNINEVLAELDKAEHTPIGH